MAKTPFPAVLTANDLLDGDTVWWTGARWSRRIDDALIAMDEEAAISLETAGADAPHVVGAYLVEVDPVTTTPTARREAIRASRAPTFAYGAAAETRKAA